MSRTIQHKRSSVAGNKPDDTQIAVGELAINFPDKTIYTKNANGEIIEVGESSPWQEDSAGNNIYYNEGNVGIGTVTPSGFSSYRTLDIEGGDMVGGAVRLSTSDGKHAYMFNYGTTGYFGGQEATLLTVGPQATAKTAYRADTAGFHRWYDPSDGSTERMRIDEVGNVGVNVNLPAAKLHVHSAVVDQEVFKVSGFNVGRGLAVGVYNEGGVTDARVDFNNILSNGRFSWSLGGSEKMRISESGDVSINGNVTGRVINSTNVNNRGGLFRTTDTVNSKQTALGSMDFYGSSGSSAASLGFGAIGTDKNESFIFRNAKTGGDFTFISPAGVGIGGDPASIGGGDAKLQVDGDGYFSGNVGIGVNGANLDESLVVQGSIKLRGANALWFTNTSGTTGLEAVNSKNLVLQSNATDAELGFETNGSERMRIDALGNVGIGTDTALYTGVGRQCLTINGDASANIVFGQGKAPKHYILSDSAGLTFGDDTGGNMLIDTSGNVGIGTDNPAEKLVVSGNLGFAYNDTLAPYTIGKTPDQFGLVYNSNVTSSTNEIAHTFSSGVTSNIMSMTYGGNVGIGTDNPSSSLTISTGGSSRIQTTNGSQTLYSGTWAGLNRVESSGSQLNIGTGDANNLVLRTNNTDRVTIDASGTTTVTGGLNASSVRANGPSNTGAPTTSISPAILVNGGAVGPGEGGELRFTGFNNTYGFAAIKGAIIDASVNATGWLDFYTRSSTSDTDMTLGMRLDQLQNLSVTGNVHSAGTRIEVDPASLTSAMASDTDSLYVDSDGTSYADLKLLLKNVLNRLATLES